MPNPYHHSDLIGRFAQHKVAANLLMVIMLLSGVMALSKLNTQFMPSFEIDIVQVRVVWRGATAEDIEVAIAQPLENELRYVDHLKKMTSTSTDGVAVIILEYDEGVNMGDALDLVKEKVALVRDLPTQAEKPEVSRITAYDPIARVVVTTDSDLQSLLPWIKGFESDLIRRGISKIDITGLPKEEILIQIPMHYLQDTGLSIADIGERVADFSHDTPAGNIGREDVARQLRSLDQRRDAQGFEELAVKTNARGQRILLKDIAQIGRQQRADQVRIFFRGKPGIEMRLKRAESADALKAAKILEEWVADSKPRLPVGLSLYVFDETWKLIDERLMLLVKNGGGGLILVVAILFLFLNARVALWVAVGIPTSFMAALAILYLVGGSINMLSMFALIMTLGIIVDDAIVVGEDAVAHYQQGEPPLQASEGGARRMFAPVISSSLTTIAAFLPLMIVGGIIGKILFDIPLIVICVILASLVESFLVLPGHLRHTFVSIHHAQPSRVRKRLDAGFVAFRDSVYRPVLVLALNYRGTTLAVCLAALILSFGLLAGGRIGFHFFPTPDGTILYASASFVKGTSPERTEKYMQYLMQTLVATEAELGGDLVAVTEMRLGIIGLAAAATLQSGDHLGSIIVELTHQENRSTSIHEFIKAWESRVQPVAGLDSISIFAQRSGPPGRDIEVRLFGESLDKVKAASLLVQQTLSNTPGVSGIEDDMPFGQEQLIFSVTPEGEALGLSAKSIGRQLRTAYDGDIVQIFYDGDSEVEVRVALTLEERNHLSSIDSFAVKTPNGNMVPLFSVATMHSKRGFSSIRHADGKLAALVSADVDHSANHEDKINNMMKTGVLQDVNKRFGVSYAFEGRSADQKKTMADMKKGGLFALCLIYLVLAWVFSSYGWPLVVMAVIPFGVVGAIVGHWLMGIDLTILSMFGVFGLAGIVVNDSIILLTFFKELNTKLPTDQAIVAAACLRLRAVLLTSLTTIAGLLPLLFETSLQAQFLIPMAVSISFGLAFATFLVLLLVPTLLSLHESFRRTCCKQSQAKNLNC